MSGRTPTCFRVETEGQCRVGHLPQERHQTTHGIKNLNTRKTTTRVTNSPARVTPSRHHKGARSPTPHGVPLVHRLFEGSSCSLLSCDVSLVPQICLCASCSDTRLGTYFTTLVSTRDAKGSSSPQAAERQTSEIIHRWDSPPLADVKSRHEPIFGRTLNRNTQDSNQKQSVSLPPTYNPKGPVPRTNLHGGPGVSVALRRWVYDDCLEGHRRR